MDERVTRTGHTDTKTEKTERTEPCDSAARSSALPKGFDVESWTRAACDASRVPFAVEDPVVLAKLRNLAMHPA